MPPATEENGSTDHGLNNEKNQNGFAQTTTNKSFAYSILMNLSTAWRTYTQSLDTLLEQYGAYEAMESVIQHLTKHPFLAFGMLICVLSCALPFIIFMIFATATVIMTFTGFVIIEGTLITIASALLFGFLGAVVVFLLCFSLVLLAGYFGLVQIYEVIGYPNKRRAIIDYLRSVSSNRQTELHQN